MSWEDVNVDAGHKVSVVCTVNSLALAGVINYDSKLCHNLEHRSLIGVIYDCNVFIIQTKGLTKYTYLNIFILFITYYVEYLKL